MRDIESEIRRLRDRVEALEREVESMWSRMADKVDKPDARPSPKHTDTLLLGSIGVEYE